MSTSRRVRNRRGEGGRLRTEILAAATELLDTGSDERAMTMRAVARQAGISAPSIYPHFIDSSAIMLAVVQQGFAELIGLLRACTTDPDQWLHAVCTAYVDFAQTYPRRYRAMFGDLRHLTNDAVAILGAEAIQIIADSLTACVTSGHCVSKDPAVDAIALWLGLHGLAHQRAVTSSYPWPADITERVAFPLAHLIDVQ